MTQAKFRCLKQDMEESSIRDASDESPRLQTKVDGSNKFTPDVIRCVMELIGEAEVPGTRCGRVMKIVVRHLFSQDMPLTEFPSERTALRMSDCAHALAKNQVGEALVHSKGYDLHSDGTDRDHNKVVGHQVTTKEQGTLSIGFVGVQTENTDTLLDVAVNLLKELAYVYDEDETEKSFKAMLTNMTGLMSDRASVMKSFGRKLNETRQKELGQTDNLEFLHCNAHFLLGLSTASEKTLSSVEKEIGEDLGRDKLTQFATRFRGSSENSTSRYIRTACDCLGPRGDEKSGCRDAWEAFCDMTDRRSCVSSYRSNRFNNYFQAGAALHYHREDINSFFNNYLPGGNLKLQSVHADCKSDTIDEFMVAIGILYYRVTGPYWQLIASQTKYLDFYQYAQKMLNAFREWATDAKTLLQKDSPPLFEKFVLPETNEMKSLFTLPDNRLSRVKSALEQLCAAFATVTERQLADFLDGGCYSNVQDPERREKMDHCLLTNLIGEACFGDLDFSIFKRRNASLHHHSTVNMLKRNRTVSVWLSNKSEEEQRCLLDMSAKKAPILREKHKQMQKDVVEKRKEILEENRRKREEKLDAALKRKQAVAQEVKDHGGPCLSSRDVDELLTTLSARAKGGKTSVTEAVKSEIRYQQLVMGVSRRQLKLSAPLDELVTNLKTFLDEVNGKCNINLIH